MERRWNGGTTAKLIVASLLGLIFVAPFIYMTLAAFAESFPLTGTIDLASYNFTFKNMVDLFTRAQLYIPILNSSLIAIVVMISNLLLCTICGYALARRRFRLKGPIMITVVLVLMIPAHVVIIPMYVLTKWMGIYDTYLALILPFAVMPLGIFLMRQYISGIPTDMEEAARLEGAGEFTIIMRVILPLCKPALAVLGVQVFLINWNSFLYPFILTSSESMRTLPVALALLQGYQSINIPQLFAASLISALPTAALFIAFSRRITEGIIAGALKG